MVWYGFDISVYRCVCECKCHRLERFLEEPDCHVRSSDFDACMTDRSRPLDRPTEVMGVGVREVGGGEIIGEEVGGEEMGE